MEWRELWSLIHLYENSNPHSLLTAFRLLLLTLYCFCLPIQSQSIFFLPFPPVFRLFVVFWKAKRANIKCTKVHLWARLLFSPFYVLGVFQELTVKGIRSFSIIWLQQVGHCMNEIAIIEFESFQEKIALDDTALKLPFPLSRRHRFEGLKQRFAIEKKDIFIVGARKAQLLISIVMSNEENHIILRTPSNWISVNVCGGW